MALISCPECGKEFSDRAVSCPNCGFPVSEMESDQEETLLNEIYENHKINAFSAIKEYMEKGKSEERIQPWIEMPEMQKP